MTQWVAFDSQINLPYCCTINEIAVFISMTKYFALDSIENKMEAPMAELSLEKVSDLLGTQEIPGSENELKVLCIRIRELVEMNGENWVRQNRQKLLKQWESVVKENTIKS